jgi:hypothetical protein
MLVGFILNIVFNLVLRTLYQLENEKRDRALEGKSEEEIEALREESRAQGFENVTDKQNVSWKSESLVLCGMVLTVHEYRCSSGMCYEILLLVNRGELDGGMRIQARINPPISSGTSDRRNTP